MLLALFGRESQESSLTEPGYQEENSLKHSL